MRVGYLVHDLNDAAVSRRARMLEIGGAQVALAGFTREADLRPSVEARAPLVLGQSHDAAFAQRAALAMKNTVRNRELRERFADCDLIMARNLEQLAIASRIVGKRALVYECLDIHRLLVSSGLPARLVQRLEAALLPRCDLVLTSSPAFIRNHFQRHSLKAPIDLIENKLLIDPQEPRQQPLAPATATRSDRPITIGWFGMLRCRRTLAFLEDLVASSNGRVEALIAGKPSSAELPDLEQRVAARAGLTFHGPYSYADLPELYGRCDFAWSIDWFEEGLNSAWLLPNRLYEAITYDCVPIALTDVEVGRWLEAQKVGLLVRSADDAKTTLLSMTRAKAAELSEGVRRIPASKTTAGVSDCEQLVARFAGLLPR